MAQLRIYKDKKEIGEYTAKIIAEQINNFKPSEHKKHFVLGLPTGSSPLPTYESLISLFKQGKVSFKNVITFNMDEYLGLSPSDSNSYHHFMHSNFFDHVDVPKQNIHILDGLTLDPVRECENFELDIQKAGGIDFFLAGIGSDGHLAFNEPGSSLASRTRKVTLCPQTIQDNARFFGNELQQVPKSALSVGLATVMGAKKVWLVATGRNKSVAIRNIIEKGVSAQWPASVLQMHQDAVVCVDPEATEELKVKTVNYYQSLM